MLDYTRLSAKITYIFKNNRNSVSKKINSEILSIANNDAWGIGRADIIFVPPGDGVRRIAARGPTCQPESTQSDFVLEEEADRLYISPPLSKNKPYISAEP